MKINKKIFFLIEFCIFFALFYVLAFASINKILYPFAFGMLFALAWANQKVWIITPTYIIASILKDYSFENIVQVFATVLCLVVPYLIHVLCKKNIRKWELAIYCGLSQTAKIVFDILDNIQPYYCILNVAIGVIFMFACIGIFEAIIIRGFSNKLTSLETVYLMSIILAISSGLVTFNFYNFSVLKFFVSFLILLFAFSSSPILTFLMSTVSGVGSMLAENNPVYIAPFILMTLAVIAFKQTNKYYMVISLILVECINGFYFSLYYSFGIIEMLPCVISALIFCLLPKKILSEISVVLNSKSDRLALKNVVNRNREILYKRLDNLSEVFNNMNIVYRNLIKKSMGEEDAKAIIYEEIRDKCCQDCPEKNRCHRTFLEDTKKVFKELTSIAFERGKSTLLDIPSYLSARCGRINSILSNINTLSSQYKKYVTLVGNIDDSKLLIADHLQGLSHVIKKLSKEVDSSVSFDVSRENKIMEELTYHNILCCDAVVYMKDIKTSIVSLVVRNDDANKLRISDAVTKACGEKMLVYEIFPSSRPGYQTINLKSAPKYDCVFGVAQKTKQNSSSSGDGYSVLRLDGDRFMFAICDGMGSGENAEKVSETTLSLIENFYKAGFDNDVILSSVNRLLNLHKEEIFSAIDICIVDLKSAIIDFIKMGAVNSYIRNDEACKIIESGSLPLGIIQNATPLAKKTVLTEKDYIIICSDGIADSFASDESLRDCIASIDTTNPQDYADKILQYAIANNNGYAIDDMTVMVVKIFAL